jgi:tRNA nucleotidyltransferase (CCA-adding enzyme)
VYLYDWDAVHTTPTTRANATRWHPVGSNVLYSHGAHVKIIIGHSNMDLDCIASIVLARRLHPEHVPVKSGTIHPVAKHLYNLYEGELEFLPAKELRGETVSEIVIVDTCSRSRVQEYFTALGLDDGEPGCPVTIYDHHPRDANDFPGATVHGGGYGATATILGMELIRRGLTLSPAQATIALAGIYGDTGNFTHGNVTSDEFTVAAHLLASVALVTSFLKSLRQEEQIDLFHLALTRLETRTIKGHTVGLFRIELEKQLPGLAAVVERVFEVEELDALFGTFAFVHDGARLVVGRSRKRRIEVNRILERFGGGGHEKAASALVKHATPLLEEEVLDGIESGIAPAVTAADIMSRDVSVLREDWSLLEASLFLERIDHTGGPVVDANGSLVGFLTLRDIMKGRKNDVMNAPVKGYMSRRVITCRPDHSMHDLERLFFAHNIGHLPVTDAEALVGIVTRSDYLTSIERTRADQAVV